MDDAEDRQAQAGGLVLRVSKLVPLLVSSVALVLGVWLFVSAMEVQQFHWAFWSLVAVMLFSVVAFIMRPADAACVELVLGFGRVIIEQRVEHEIEKIMQQYGRKTSDDARKILEEFKPQLVEAVRDSWEDYRRVARTAVSSGSSIIGGNTFVNELAKTLLEDPKRRAIQRRLDALSNTEVPKRTIDPTTGKIVDGDQ